MSCQQTSDVGDPELSQAALTVTKATPFKETAVDGYALGGFTWRHSSPDSQRPVVIINAATSVRCRHYSRFAAYLFCHGFDVMTYDYRGIGESRSESIKGLRASWLTGALWISKRCSNARSGSFPVSQSMWSPIVSAVARRAWRSRAR